MSQFTNFKKSVSVKRPRFNNSLDELEMSYEEESVFKSKPDPEIEKVNQQMNDLASLENPTLKDILTAVLGVMQMQVSTKTDINAMKSSISTIENKLAAHDLRIKNLENQNDDFNDRIVTNKASINIMKQKEIDCNVMITGFVQKPDAHPTTKKILEIYKVNMNTVLDTYSYDRPFYDKKKKEIIPNKTRSFLVIAFKSKADQLQFIKQKKAIGPLKYGQIFPSTKQTPAGNTDINSFMMLTAENRQIQQTLHSLMEKDLLAEIKYKNCNFFIKIKANSPLIPVSTIEHADYLDINLRANKT